MRKVALQADFSALKNAFSFSVLKSRNNIDLFLLKNYFPFIKILLQ